MAHQALAWAFNLGAQLGLSFQPAKVVGPATLIEFLGLELDSVAMEVRLPGNKLNFLIQLLDSWAACLGVISDKARDFLRACWRLIAGCPAGLPVGDAGAVVASLVAGRLDDNEARPNGIFEIDRCRRKDGRRSLEGMGRASRKLAW